MYTFGVAVPEETEMEHNEEGPREVPGYIQFPHAIHALLYEGNYIHNNIQVEYLRREAS